MANSPRGTISANPGIDRGAAVGWHQLDRNADAQFFELNFA
jgi:hypothetical protein